MAFKAFQSDISIRLGADIGKKLIPASVWPAWKTLDSNVTFALDVKVLSETS